MLLFLFLSFNVCRYKYVYYTEERSCGNENSAYSGSASEDEEETKND